MQYNGNLNRTAVVQILFFLKYRRWLFNDPLTMCNLKKRYNKAGTKPTMHICILVLNAKYKKITNSAGRGTHGARKSLPMQARNADVQSGVQTKMRSGPDKHSIRTRQNLSQLSNQWLQVRISELTLQVSYSCVCTGGLEFEARNKPQGFPPPAMF